MTSTPAPHQDRLRARRAAAPAGAGVATRHLGQVGWDKLAALTHGLELGPRELQTLELRWLREARHYDDLWRRQRTMHDVLGVFTIVAGLAPSARGGQRSDWALALAGFVVTASTRWWGSFATASAGDISAGPRCAESEGVKFLRTPGALRCSRLASERLSALHREPGADQRGPKRGVPRPVELARAIARRGGRRASWRVTGIERSLATSDVASGPSWGRRHDETSRLPLVVLCGASCVSCCDQRPVRARPISGDPAPSVPG